MVAYRSSKAMVACSIHAVGNKWIYYDACERAFQTKLRDNGHICVQELETSPVRTGWCGLNTCVKTI